MPPYSSRRGANMLVKYHVTDVVSVRLACRYDNVDDIADDLAEDDLDFLQIEDATHRAAIMANKKNAARTSKDSTPTTSTDEHVKTAIQHVQEKSSSVASTPTPTPAPAAPAVVEPEHEVHTWLKSFGMERYAPVFLEKG